MTDQQTIEQVIIGKRIVAVAWRPIAIPGGVSELESITLEGGAKLRLSIYYRNPRDGDVIVAEVEETETTMAINAQCVCPLCNQGHDPKLIGDSGEGKNA